MGEDGNIQRCVEKGLRFVLTLTLPQPTMLSGRSSTRWGGVEREREDLTGGAATPLPQPRVWYIHRLAFTHLHHCCGLPYNPPSPTGGGLSIADAQSRVRGVKPEGVKKIQQTPGHQASETGRFHSATLDALFFHTRSGYSPRTCHYQPRPLTAPETQLSRQR